MKCMSGLIQPFPKVKAGMQQSLSLMPSLLRVAVNRGGSGLSGGIFLAVLKGNCQTCEWRYYFKGKTRGAGIHLHILSVIFLTNQVKEYAWRKEERRPSGQKLLDHKDKMVLVNSSRSN